MTKRYFFCFYILAVCLLPAFTEKLHYVQPQTTGLDIELSQVELTVEAFDGDRIAYRYQLNEEKKLSCIETQKTLRIRQFFPAKGTLHLFIPKSMLLENCSIRSNCADIRLENVSAVHLLIMMNRGTVQLNQCRFKNTVINLAHGNLVLNKTDIIRSAAIAVSYAAADIALLGKESEYHIDYVHNGGALTIAGKNYTKNPGQYGNPSAKRRIIFSGGASTAVIRFIEKDTQTQ